MAGGAASQEKEGQLMSLGFGAVTRPTWIALEYLRWLGLETCEPPTPLDEVLDDLERRGIEVIFYHLSEVPEEDRLSAGADEYLVRTCDEVILGINKDRPVTRQRFSIFHGIGHELMVWHHEANYLTIGCVMHPLTTRPYELEAHQFAAVMNMPPRKFKEDMVSLPLGLSSIIELADRYTASVESAAIHYASLSDRPCCIAILNTILLAHATNDPIEFLGVPLQLDKPNEKGEQTAEKQLRVRYSRRSATFPYSVRRGIRIMEGANPFAWTSQFNIEAAGQISGLVLGINSQARFSVECRPLNPIYNPGELIALIRPVTSKPFSVVSFPLRTEGMLSTQAIGGLQ
jgi:hypothetical protein